MREQRRAGFTAIDLLVIVLVLVILAVILFPVFSQRKFSGADRCLSNAKQIDLSVIMYSDDADDRLPPMSNPSQKKLWTDLLFPYYKNRSILTCPLDQSGAISYGLNALAFFDPVAGRHNSMQKTLSYAQFVHPNETIMLTEVGYDNDFITPLIGTYKAVAPDGVLRLPYEARPAFRHAGVARLGYMDGHAKSWRKEAFYTGQKPLDYWWCRDRGDLATCKSN